jgi:hypothetical protein
VHARHARRVLPRCTRGKGEHVYIGIGTIILIIILVILLT